MKKYEVEWYDHAAGNPVSHVIEAESKDAAFAKAVEKYKYIIYPRIRISLKGGLYEGDFANPHNVEPKKAVVEKFEGSRPQQPAGTDGSVGWYENLDESDLSDRDILLAQLHELRTIKRCVVCTILIVIVIPIVFGVIASA